MAVKMRLKRMGHKIYNNYDGQYVDSDPSDEGFEQVSVSYENDTSAKHAKLDITLSKYVQTNSYAEVRH